MPVVERKAPPRLALVPRDQLQARSPTKANTGALQQSTNAQERRRVRAAIRARIERQRNVEHHKTLSNELAEVDADATSGTDILRECHAEYGVTRDADDCDGVTDREQQQLRLGERFLRMMATMARLARVPLDSGNDSGADAMAVASGSTTSLSVLEQIAEKTETLQRLSPLKTSPIAAAPAGKFPTKGAAAPLLVPVNVATEPLRSHLTFEVSMLLPPPIDTRQSALQSPIQRKPVRLKRRRCKKRVRREKRSWQTSHATWAPRASAAYIDERNTRHESATSSLVAQFAQLKHVSAATDALARSSSLPALPSRQFLYAFPATKQKQSRQPVPVHSDVGRRSAQSGASVGSEGDGVSDASDGSESSSASRASDSNDSESDREREHQQPSQQQGVAEPLHTQSDDSHACADNNEPPFGSSSCGELAPPTDSDPDPISPDALPAVSYLQAHITDAAAATAPAATRPLYHQPAWISPDLSAWLVASGMFPTRQRRC